MASRARDCAGAETIGAVGILGLRELSPAPFSSFSLAFLGSSCWPLREFTTGERIFSGFLVRDVGERTMPTSLRRVVGENLRVVWEVGRGFATSKVHSRGVFEENLKFFDIRLIRSDLLE